MSRKVVAISCVVIGVILVIVFAVLATIKSQQSPVHSIAKQIKTFNVYYFKGAIPDNFRLQEKTVTYQRGILVFSLKSPNNKTIAITEQSIPRAFNADSLNAQDTFNTLYGKGLLTDADDRTTGALITDDHTWILINAPSPVGADTMKAVINALRPLD